MINFSMACRGVFFALTAAERERLLAYETDRERLGYVLEEIEQAWDEKHLLQTDKAWDAIHRCLTDGTLIIGPDPKPLGKVILGGRQLYSNTERFIINLIEADVVPEVAVALKAVTEEWMRNRYDRLRDTDYPQDFVSDQDWQYTWDWFSGIPDFFAHAAEEHRSVIFTVDQ